MDPEIVAQLEEQLRQLTDTIANQTSMMGAQMDAMNKMGSSASRAAQATNRNTDTSNQATTKYQEAQLKAAGQTDKSTDSLRKLEAAVGVLSAAVGGAAGVFGALAGSLLSSQKGFAKYGQVVDAAAQGLEGLAKAIPIVGDALGALVGTLGKAAAKIATDMLTLLDSTVNLRDGLAKTAGVLPVNAEQLATLAKNAGFSGERMAVLGKVTADLGPALRGLSETAGRGSVKFMEMADVSDETRKKFGLMGVDQDRLLELQALYVKQQYGMGNAYEMQTKSAKQLQKESLAYAENMQKLSALTGKAAEEQQAEQDALNAVVQERMEMVKDLSLEKKLRDEKRFAEADEVKKRRELRESIGAALAKENLTLEDQMKIKQMYRSGITDFNKSLLMVNSNTPAILNAMKTGAISVEEGAKQLAGGMREGQARFSTALSGVADHMSEDELKGNFNLESEALLRQSIGLKQALGESTAALEKDLAGKTATNDKIGALAEEGRQIERDAQAAYQDQLMAGLKALAGFTDITDLANKAQEHAKTMAYALAAGFVAVTVAQGALAVAAWRAANNLNKLASGGFGGGGDGGGPLGDAESKAKGKGRGRFGRLAKVGRFLGRAGGVVAVGAAAYEGYTGYQEAKEQEKAGKITAEQAKKKKGEAVGGAVGGGVGGLAGGALAGAAIGSVVPVVGTAIGGIIGGALGYWAGSKAGKAVGGYVSGGSDKPDAKSAEKQARDKRNAELQKRLNESRKAAGAPAAAAAIPGAAKAVPAAAAAGAAGVAGAANAGTLSITQQQEMQEQILRDQIERNKKIFSEPMQQTEEERKAQTQVFTDLTSSMTAFKKNIDGSSKALIDLMNASDELYKALTGRDRPGSEAANAAAGTTGPAGAAGNIPQDVQGNLEKIGVSLRKAGFTDDNYINAVLGNVMKESGGRFDKQEDIAGYANTDNARIRELFGNRVAGKSDAELNALKADPTKFAEAIYGSGTKQGRQMGNTQPGDGWKFRGRGPIQLTGRANYAKASKDIYGDDRLVQDPDLVMDPTVGAEVVAWFMKQNESQMRGKLGFNKGQALSQADAALLATSQIAGQKITRGVGHLGKENLEKAESYAAQMPIGMGTGKSFVTNDSLIGATRQATGALKDFAVTGQARTGGNLTSVSTQGKTAQVSVDAAPQFQKLLDAMTKSGYKIKSLGGYINRNIAGTNVPSAHGMGWAIDVNPDENPDTGKSNKLITDMPPEVIKYARELGLGWGGGWRNKKDAMHFSAQKNEGGWLQAARGGIFRGPKEGYPMELHGTEMIVPLDTPSMRGNKIGDVMSSVTKTGVLDNISQSSLRGKEATVPLDNKFTRSQSSESYTVNGKPASKKQYESFMSSHPELQGLQDKVKSMLTTMQDNKMDPSKLMKSASSLMDTNLTGIKDEVIDKNRKIQDSLMQLVSNETSKAISAITEANTPLQTISSEISNSMRKVMEAHNSTMNELTYKLGDMIDALNTSNDVTKKILKKASA